MAISEPEPEPDEKQTLPIGDAFRKATVPLPRAKTPLVLRPTSLNQQTEPRFNVITIDEHGEIVIQTR